jgi:hypothetical protein
MCLRTVEKRQRARSAFKKVFNGPGTGRFHGLTIIRGVDVVNHLLTLSAFSEYTDLSAF